MLLYIVRCPFALLRGINANTTSGMQIREVISGFGQQQYVRIRIFLPPPPEEGVTFNGNASRWAIVSTVSFDSRTRRASTVDD